jgi:hypothetical protein
MTSDATGNPNWQPATAVVSSAEPMHGISQTLETDDYPSREYYFIHFRYMVGGQTYGGKFESRSPVPPEHTFEILYNPDNPQQNTRSGSVTNRTSKITFAVLAVIIAAVLAFIAFILFRH